MQFRQVFEFNQILMPGRAKVRLRVKDWDGVSLDDLIGWTDIDLEHRYFCNQWSRCDLKPVETRELSRQKKGQESTHGNGSLHLWVDIFPVRTGFPVPPAIDIKLPEPENFQLRVIVWDAEDMHSDDGTIDDGGGTSMNDLYVSGHLRTKARKILNEQKQETDTHWRAKGGAGNFNWRFVFDFEVDQQLPVQHPCSFTLKAWDRDPLQFKSDFLGQKEVPIADIVEDGLRQLREKKRLKMKVDSLLDNGRTDEMLLEMQSHRRANEGRKRQLSSKKQLAREHRCSKDSADAGGTDHDEASESCLTKLCNPVRTLWRETHLPHNQGYDVRGEEDRAYQYKWQNVRKWELEDLEGQTTGTVWVSVELLHKSIADAQPAGKGRESPNAHPVLEEPLRETISLANPLATLRFFVGPARLRKARMIVVLLLVVALAWSILSTSIGVIITSFLSKDVFSVLTQDCPEGKLVPDQLYNYYCCAGQSDGQCIFGPKIDEWMDCLGPPGQDQGDLFSQFPCTSAGKFSNNVCQSPACLRGLARFNVSTASLAEATRQDILNTACKYGGKHFNNAFSWDTKAGSETGATCEWHQLECTNLACSECLSITEPLCPPGRSTLHKVFWRVLLLGVALVVLLRLVLMYSAAPAIQALCPTSVCVHGSRCLGVVGGLYQRLPGWSKKVLKLVQWLLVFLLVWWL